MLGERLKKMRSKKGYTLAKLEELSGVSYVQIGRYEKGKATPNATTIKKLADAFQVSVDSILLDPPVDELIKNEEIEERIRRFHELFEESNSKRRALKEILDSMLFEGDIHKRLANR